MVEDKHVWNPGWDTVRADAAKKEADPEVVLEPFLWGLFSLGGFLTAFLLPITIVLLVFAVPLGLWPASRVDYDWFNARFVDPIFRLFLLLLIAGSLFHGMHRLKFMLLDLGLKKGERLADVVLYGIAILGSLAALYYTFLVDFRPPF